MRAPIALLLAAVLAVTALATTATAAPTREAAAKPTIVGVAAGDKRFSTLVALVKQAGLVTTLSRQGAVHRLRADECRVREAQEDRAGHLRRRHDRQGAAEEGAHLPRAREEGSERGRGRGRDEEGAPSPTVQGEKIKLSLKNGKLYLNGNSQVVVADVAASNGVIHAINTVIVPPSVR